MEVNRSIQESFFPFGLMKQHCRFHILSFQHMLINSREKGADFERSSEAAAKHAINVHRKQRLVPARFIEIFRAAGKIKTVRTVSRM